MKITSVLCFTRTQYLSYDIYVADIINETVISLHISDYTIVMDLTSSMFNKDDKYEVITYDTDDKSFVEIEKDEDIRAKFSMYLI